MSLPLTFCWTRVGTEAGQTLDSILHRKEAERLANAGVFFWGIGNAIGPSLRELLCRSADPEVLFTPIKSAARKEDSEPERVVRWTRAHGLDGRAVELPERTLITSRFDDRSRKATHYALVCHADTPLTKLAAEQDSFASCEVKNLLTGRPVGGSQVTAVVRRQEGDDADRIRAYRVLLRARLAPPFFLRLSEPVPLTRKGLASNWEASVNRRWSALVSDTTDLAI